MKRSPSDYTNNCNGTLGKLFKLRFYLKNNLRITIENDKLLSYSCIRDLIIIDVAFS